MFIYLQISQLFIEKLYNINYITYYRTRRSSLAFIIYSSYLVPKIPLFTYLDTLP